LRRNAFAIALVATVPLAGLARSARADGPIDFEVAGRVGSGTNPGWIANPFAASMGGRAGVSVYGFYAGLSATYTFNLSGGVDTFHSVLIGIEGGYTFKLPHLRLRPQVCVGDGTFSQEEPDGVLNPPVTTQVGNVFVEPGVVGIVPLGPLFVGLDANVLLLPAFTLFSANDVALPAKTYASFTAHAQLGVLF
jgi:hypothetical protein